MMDELNERFWIKKTVRSIIKDAKKDVKIERLTVTLADENGTNITINGDPDLLEWLESGLEANVHIMLKTKQSTLTERERPQKGDAQPAKEDIDEGWDPDTNE